MSESSYTSFPPPPREYHGIYIHIGEESYFKVGAIFATSLPLRERGWKPSPPPYALYTTSVSHDSRRLLDHPSSPSKPSSLGFRGLLQPKFGQQNEDGASVPAETPDVIMTPVSYFWSPQVFPEMPVNIIRYV